MGGAVDHSGEHSLARLPYWCGVAQGTAKYRMVSGGAVESVLAGDSSSPGSQAVEVRMGPQRGAQVFRLEAGGLQLDVSIPVQ